MKQVRNLILNYVWNILAIAILIVINHYIFDGMSRIYSIVALVVEILAITFVTNSIQNPKEDTPYYVLPPFGMVHLVFLSYYLLSSNFRRMNVGEHRVFILLTEDDMELYYFNWFGFHIVEHAHDWDKYLNKK